MRFSAAFTALLLAVALLPSTSCQSSNAQTQGTSSGNGASNTPASNSGVWFGGSNLGNLNTSPAALLSPQITQAGSYMFLGNVSIQETTGGYPKVTCFVQVGTAALLPSITGVESSQQGNVTVTGAVALTSTEVPTTAALMCGYNGNGTAEVTQASLSIFSVGTLQTGP